MKTTMLFRQLASWQLAAVLTLAGGAAFDAHINAAPLLFGSVNNDSDILGVAHETDTELINPWGLTTGTEGNLHVADNVTGVSTLYGPDGSLLTFSSTISSITIPSVSSDPTGSPSGVVENAVGILTDTNDFVITNGANTGSAHYLYCTEDGAIEGFRTSVDATSAVVGPNDANQSGNGTSVFGTGAGYTGLALSWAYVTTGPVTTLNHRLYAANFRQGRIDEFDNSFNLVTLTGTDTFTDTNMPPIPAGSPVGAAWSPFNIHHIDFMGKDSNGKFGLQRRLIVAYALHAPGVPMNDIPAVGNGFVDVFAPDGSFDRRLVGKENHATILNSPWGLAISHTSIANFKAPIVILVGNHGDGQINAYSFDPAFPDLDGVHLGTMIKDGKGTPLAFDGLWALHFAPIKLMLTRDLQTLFNTEPSAITDLHEDDKNLYFSAGIDGETHGLVGKIVIPKRK